MSPGLFVDSEIAIWLVGRGPVSKRDWLLAILAKFVVMVLAVPKINNRSMTLKRSSRAILAAFGKRNVVSNTDIRPGACAPFACTWLALQSK